MPPGRVGHAKKHDVGSAHDHKGDIYDGLVGSANPITLGNYVVDLKKLTDTIAGIVAGLHWQPNIIRFEAMVTNEPVGPSDGDRYISTEAGNIPSTTQAVLINDVCEWDSGTSLWLINTPNDGWAVIEDGVNPNKAWIFDGANWNDFSGMLNHAGLLNINWAAAGHTMDINLSMNTHKITDMVDPGAAQDGATRNYVDVADALAVLLAGRAGGQIVFGGDATGNDLELKANSVDANIARMVLKDNGDFDIGYGKVLISPIFRYNKTTNTATITRVLDMSSLQINNLQDPATPQDADTQNARDAAITTHTTLPNAHHTPPTLPGDIENGGGSEMSVAGLSGLLADDQHIIDAEAVTAMGVKGDANPLNHDRPIQATESIVGIAEIATQAETDAGTDDTRIVTPKKLAAYSGMPIPPKAGVVASGSFVGTPERKATVTFNTAFANANYSVGITGADARSWTIESKLAGSFVINSGSATALTGNTDWTATPHNDP